MSKLTSSNHYVQYKEYLTPEDLSLLSNTQKQRFTSSPCVGWSDAREMVEKVGGEDCLQFFKDVLDGNIPPTQQL